MSAPVRVLLVAPRFPPDLGGLETYAGWVAQVLRDDPGFEVCVVTTTPGPRRLVERYAGTTVVRLPTLVTLSNSPLHPAWWFQVRALVRRLRPDVVDVHAPVPGLADVTAYAVGSTPLVMTYHAGSMVKGVGGAVDALLETYERHVLPRVFARCRALVAVSPVSMAFRTGRATLIPPGVDTAFFRPSHTEPEPTVLFAGRLERTSRWKGVHVLLDALPAVARAVPGVRLEVAGDGDALPGLHAQADRLGVGDRVRWWGRLDAGQLAERYRATAVTALPSLTDAESFGMTLVEAMASGRPVVGSRVGGIPYVVRDGVDGLLAAPGDPDSLAGALTRVLTEPGLGARLGTAGREAAVERWDWSHQRELTTAVLREAAGR